MFRILKISVLSYCLITFSTGCSGKPEVVKAKSGDMANAKLTAMNRMAEQFAKNPNDPVIFESLEDFRNSQYDPATEKEIGKQILEIFKSKIAGKYTSELAKQLTDDMRAFEASLNK